MTMNYSYDEVLEFIEQEDVKFIRLAFLDIHGKQKNVSIMPDELPRAFTDGISFDASAIDGFGSQVQSDLFLFPIPSTLNILPWRPSHGKVVRMFCEIRYPDGRPFEKDSRYLLRKAIKAASEQGIQVSFGSEFEFYLFKTDENGEPTKEPFDHAGYMDVAPADKGENVRREICLTLLEMGIHPEASHHEEGPGQNEIDFRHSEPMLAADNATNFISVVEASAAANGLWADFSPKPLPDAPGSGLHINISAKSADGSDPLPAFMAGIISHIKEITLFLNSSESSYKRLGGRKAPKYITWSPQNRSQLVRLPAAKGDARRFELRSPDPETNLYLAYALLIHAGLDGIEKKLSLPEATNINLNTADSSITNGLDTLPSTLEEAISEAKKSRFVSEILPAGFIEQFIS